MLAASYESSGLFVTEDVKNNVFAMDRSADGVIRYACMYGTTVTTFYEFEIPVLEMLINSYANTLKEESEATEEYVHLRWAYKNYKTKPDKILAKDKLGECKFYVSMGAQTVRYWIEQGEYRIGGTLAEWRHTLYDWKDLARCFEEWEKSM